MDNEQLSRIMNIDFLSFDKQIMANLQTSQLINDGYNQYRLFLTTVHYYRNIFFLNVMLMLSSMLLMYHRNTITQHTSFITVCIIVCISYSMILWSIVDNIADTASHILHSINNAVNGRKNNNHH